jgi:hypothetical protein
MGKVIKADDCRKCPYNQWNSHYEEWFCIRDMFAQNTPEEGFPVWCPLPDDHAPEMLEALKMVADSQGWDGNNPDEDRWTQMYQTVRALIAKIEGGE